MSLKERTYSILIVSATDVLTSAFAGLLPETRYSPVHAVSSINAARRTLTEKTYDFIIINAPLHDDMGVRLAIDISSSKQSVVLLLVKAIFITKSMTRPQNMVYLPVKANLKGNDDLCLQLAGKRQERLRQFEKIFVH